MTVSYRSSTRWAKRNINSPGVKYLDQVFCIKFKYLVLCIRNLVQSTRNLVLCTKNLVLCIRNLILCIKNQVPCARYLVPYIGQLVPCTMDLVQKIWETFANIHSARPVPMLRVVKALVSIICMIIKLHKYLQYVHPLTRICYSVCPRPRHIFLMDGNISQEQRE